MAWTSYQIFIAFVMVITGSINTLSTKWADLSYSVGSDGTKRLYDHPFLQACGMFLGELACLIVFKLMVQYKEWRKRPMTVDEIGAQDFSPLIFLFPATCDMTATSLMYIGLNLTFASSFQMLRGAIIIFTGLLSVAFLHRELGCHRWLGIMAVVAGLALVGVSDFVYGDVDASDINGVIAGDLLILIAQVVQAVQVVYEEKYIYKYNIPALQAVGWEGVFGFCMLAVLLVPMYYIPVGTFANNPNHVLEDAIDGFYQIANSAVVAVATFGNIASIAFFNFAGISIVKEINATTRVVLDSVRTLLIWMFSLAVGWQSFVWLQLVGFVVLMLGMFIYENVLWPIVVRICTCTGVPSDDADDDEIRKPLLEEETPNIQTSKVLSFPDGP